MGVLMGYRHGVVVHLADVYTISLIRVFIVLPPLDSY